MVEVQPYKPIESIDAETNRKLTGHYRYYGVTYYIQPLVKYHYSTTTLLYHWMNRRSQKKSYDWEEFKQYETDIVLW